MNWTIGERLTLTGIIAEWIMNSDDPQFVNEQAQLIVFLSSMSPRFLEKNIDKFEAAIAEYGARGGDE